nr:hypothetical protein BaRGS_032849 [Batillaria attramentaria]
MHRVGVILCLVLAVICQDRNPWNGFSNRFDSWRHAFEDVVDTFHEFRYVEHSTNTSHLLIAIHDDRDRDERTCYVVVVDKSWASLLEDRQTEERMIEEIYHLIHDPNTPSRSVSADELTTLYGDNVGSRECRGHATNLITYNPSSTVVNGGSAGTTARVRPIG